MKQKLALACTLVHEPEIILLDEPTTGVDPVSRREFWRLLSRFRATGITILMSTPYLDEAERCSRVALLDRGRLLALDEPDCAACLPARQRCSKSWSPIRARLRRPSFERACESQVFGDRLHVWLDSGADAAIEAFRSASPSGSAPPAFAGSRPRSKTCISRGLRQQRRHDENATRSFWGPLFPLLTVAHSRRANDSTDAGEAVDRAMEASHRLAEANAREAGARATVRVRESADQPTVSLSGGYTRTNHVEEFSVPQPAGVLQVIYPRCPRQLVLACCDCSGPSIPAAEPMRCSAPPKPRRAQRAPTCRPHAPTFVSKSFARIGRWRPPTSRSASWTRRSAG